MQDLRFSAAFISLIFSILPPPILKIIGSYESALEYLNKLYPNPNNSCIIGGKPRSLRDRPADLHIVIPCYNVEKYVDECIQSVLCQATKYSYHITIVDDGSTDMTSQIVDRYARYSNIDVFHQNNQGVSVARNAGLSTIKGRHIMFIDPDDVLMDGAIDALMDIAGEGDFDIVGGGYETFCDGNTSGQEVIPNPGQLFGFLWGKVYKYELWTQIQIPAGYWFQDTVCAMVIHPLAKRVATIPKCVYRYRCNAGGISLVSSHSGSVKNLDSPWVTMQLLKDRERLGLTFTQSDYDNLLGQIKINAQRVNKIGSKNVNRALFTITKDIISKYGRNFLGTASAANKRLETAILQNSYKQYILSTIYL